MTLRQRTGFRNHRCEFQQYTGGDDVHGQPSYYDRSKWTAVINEWPAEMLTTKGGEIVRGRQVTSETTHVLYGSYWPLKSIENESTVQCVIDGQVYGVLAIHDVRGDRREMRVELKWES